eukprot:29655-Heterocapsa_arctica.AAC.1
MHVHWLALAAGRRLERRLLRHANSGLHREPGSGHGAGDQSQGGVSSLIETLLLTSRPVEPPMRH